MLLRALVLVAFLAVLGESILYGAAALARVSFHAREVVAVRNAFAAGIARAQQAAIDGAVPHPSATCAYSEGSGCAITVRTAIAQATAVPGTPPSACVSAGCAVYLQSNSHVGESRASFTISEAVLASNGDVLMTRSGTVAFRTFANAPYAALVGSLDQTLDAISNGGTGDDGGNASGTAATLIHVQYQQSATGARSSGDVWRAHDERTATSTSAWDN